MDKFRNKLEWLSFEEQNYLIQSGEFITTIFENTIGYKSDLYLVENKYYVEAVYDLMEKPEELGFISLVESERLIPFIDSMELENLF